MRTFRRASRCWESMVSGVAELTATTWWVAGSYEDPAVIRRIYRSVIGNNIILLEINIAGKYRFRNHPSSKVLMETKLCG